MSPIESASVILAILKGATSETCTSPSVLGTDFHERAEVEHAHHRTFEALPDEEFAREVDDFFEAQPRPSRSCR